MKRLDPKFESWMRAAETQSVMNALGGEARFVGGAVRNALLRQSVSEVDIATPLTPDEVTKRLQAAKLGAIPTGIEHGTITAIANGKSFEVTTLPATSPPTDAEPRSLSPPIGRKTPRGAISR